MSIAFGENCFILKRLSDTMETVAIVNSNNNKTNKKVNYMFSPDKTFIDLAL